MTPQELGAVLATLVEESITPIRASVGLLDDRVKTLRELMTAAAGVGGSVAELRERVAVLETRAPVPGPPGPPGRDGLDGFGLEDFSADYDGERTITLAFARDGREARRFPLTLPFQKYQGPYEAGRTYVAGDTVTAGGSVWHCCAPTTAARPGDGVTGWQLAVKHGKNLRGPHA
jgi:hypothetical protein